jgi:hypothetical protein
VASAMRKTAVGGVVDRSMTLKELAPLLQVWAQGHEALPDVVPEPPGMLAKIMFATQGIPTGSIGRVLLTFVSQITRVRPALIRYLMQVAVQEGMDDQAAAIQQAEQRWDALVSPLRDFANFEGLDRTTRRTIMDAVGQAG